jgi:hypothetical protein
MLLSLLVACPVGLAAAICAIPATAQATGKYSTALGQQKHSFKSFHPINSC